MFKILQNTNKIILLYNTSKLNEFREKWFLKIKITKNIMKNTPKRIICNEKTGQNVRE
jgi:hypothetical protein